MSLASWTRFPSEPQKPAFGSNAPKISLATRALTSAPAHIAHGSSVTTIVVPSSRQSPIDFGRLANGDQLRVAERIARLAPVAATADDLPVAIDDDRADGNLAGRARLFRERKGFRHPLSLIHGLGFQTWVLSDSAFKE